MPRQVDHHERKREIASAAMRILARGGPTALTLRSIAAELGGSITLVTHFCATRAEIFDVVVDEALETYNDALVLVESEADDVERLRVLLRWMVPSGPGDKEREAMRIGLISHRGEHESIDRFFEQMELRMRQLLRDHLRPLDLSVDLDMATAFLRSSINGITLSAVEHPELWPEERQFDTIEIALSAICVPASIRV